MKLRWRILSIACLVVIAYSQIADASPRDVRSRNNAESTSEENETEKTVSWEAKRRRTTGKENLQPQSFSRRLDGERARRRMDSQVKPDTAESKVNSSLPRSGKNIRRGNVAHKPDSETSIIPVRNNGAFSESRKPRLLPLRQRPDIVVEESSKEILAASRGNRQVFERRTVTEEKNVLPSIRNRQRNPIVKSSEISRSDRVVPAQRRSNSGSFIDESKIELFSLDMNTGNIQNEYDYTLADKIMKDTRFEKISTTSQPIATNEVTTYRSRSRNIVRTRTDSRTTSQSTETSTTVRNISRNRSRFQTPKTEMPTEALFERSEPETSTEVSNFHKRRLVSRTKSTTTSTTTSSTGKVSLRNRLNVRRFSTTPTTEKEPTTTANLINTTPKRERSTQKSIENIKLSTVSPLLVNSRTRKPIVRTQTTTDSNQNTENSAKARGNFRPILKSDSANGKEESVEDYENENYPEHFKTLLAKGKTAKQTVSKHESLSTKSSQVVLNLHNPDSNKPSLSKPKYSRYLSRGITTTYTSILENTDPPIITNELKESLTAAPQIKSFIPSKKSEPIKNFQDKDVKFTVTTEASKPAPKYERKHKFNITRFNLLKKTTEITEDEQTSTTEKIKRPSPGIRTALYSRTKSSISRSDVTTIADNFETVSDLPSMTDANVELNTNVLPVPNIRSFQPKNNRIVNVKSTVPIKPVVLKKSPPRFSLRNIRRQNEHVNQNVLDQDIQNSNPKLNTDKVLVSSFSKTASNINGRINRFSSRYKAPLSKAPPPVYQATVPTVTSTTDLEEENNVNPDIEIISFSQPRSTPPSDSLITAESSIMASRLINVETSNHSPSVTVSIFDALADILTSTPKTAIFSTTPRNYLGSIGTTNNHLNGVSTEKISSSTKDFSVKNERSSENILSVQSESEISQVTTNKPVQILRDEQQDHIAVSKNSIDFLSVTSPSPSYNQISTIFESTSSQSPSPSTLPVTDRKPFATLILYQTTQTAAPTASIESNPLSTPVSIRSTKQAILQPEVQNTLENIETSSVLNLQPTTLQQTINSNQSLPSQDAFLFNFAFLYNFITNSTPTIDVVNILQDALLRRLENRKTMSTTLVNNVNESAESTPNILPELLSRFNSDQIDSFTTLSSNTENDNKIKEIITTKSIPETTPQTFSSITNEQTTFFETENTDNNRLIKDTTTTLSDAEIPPQILSRFSQDQMTSNIKTTTLSPTTTLTPLDSDSNSIDVSSTISINENTPQILSRFSQDQMTSNIKTTTLSPTTTLTPLDSDSNSIDVSSTISINENTPQILSRFSQDQMTSNIKTTTLSPTTTLTPLDSDSNSIDVSSTISINENTPQILSRFSQDQMTSNIKTTTLSPTTTLTPLDSDLNSIDVSSTISINENTPQILSRFNDQQTATASIDLKTTTLSPDTLSSTTSDVQINDITSNFFIQNGVTTTSSPQNILTTLETLDESTLTTLRNELIQSIEDSTSTLLPANLESVNPNTDFTEFTTTSTPIIDTRFNFQSINDNLSTFSPDSTTTDTSPMKNDVLSTTFPSNDFISTQDNSFLNTDLSPKPETQVISRINNDETIETLLKENELNGTIDSEQSDREFVITTLPQVTEQFTTETVQTSNSSTQLTKSVVNSEILSLINMLLATKLNSRLSDRPMVENLSRQAKLLKDIEQVILNNDIETFQTTTKTFNQDNSIDRTMQNTISTSESSTMINFKDVSTTIDTDEISMTSSSINPTTDSISTTNTNNFETTENTNEILTTSVESVSEFSLGSRINIDESFPSSDITSITDNSEFSTSIVENLTTDLLTTPESETNTSSSTIKTSDTSTPQTTPPYQWVPPFPTAWKKNISPNPNVSEKSQISLPEAVITTTNRPKKDYYIYGVLPNNTVVRKNPNNNELETLTEASPFIIFGVLPNNTIIRRFPNGTKVPPVTQKVDILPIDPRSLKNPYSPVYRDPDSIKPINNLMDDINTNEITQKNLTDISDNKFIKQTIQTTAVPVNKTKTMQTSKSINNKDVTDKEIIKPLTESNVLNLLTTSRLPKLEDILQNSIASAIKEESQRTTEPVQSTTPTILTLDIDPETKQIRTEKPEDGSSSVVYRWKPISNDILTTEKGDIVSENKKESYIQRITTNKPMTTAKIITTSYTTSPRSVSTSRMTTIVPVTSTESKNDIETTTYSNLDTTILQIQKNTNRQMKSNQLFNNDDSGTTQSIEINTPTESVKNIIESETNNIIDTSNIKAIPNSKNSIPSPTIKTLIKSEVTTTDVPPIPSTTVQVKPTRVSTTQQPVTSASTTQRRATPARNRPSSTTMRRQVTTSITTQRITTEPTTQVVIAEPTSVKSIVQSPSSRLESFSLEDRPSARVTSTTVKTPVIITTQASSKSTFSVEEDIAFLKSLQKLIVPKTEDKEQTLANRIIALAVDRNLAELKSSTTSTTTTTTTTARSTTTPTTTTQATTRSSRSGKKSNSISDGGTVNNQNVATLLNQRFAPQDSESSIKDDIISFQNDAKLLQSLLAITGQDPSKLKLPPQLKNTISSTSQKSPNNDVSNLKLLESILSSPSPSRNVEISDLILKQSASTVRSNPNPTKTISVTPKVNDVLVKSTLNPSIDDKQLLENLLKLQLSRETTTPKVVLGDLTNEKAIAALLSQTNRPIGSTVAPLKISTEYGKTNEAILAALLKQQGIGPSTPQEQIDLAALLNQVVVTPKLKTRTTTRPPPPPRQPRPILDGLAWLWHQWQETGTGRGTSGAHGGPRQPQVASGGGGGFLFGSGPFVGNAGEGSESRPPRQNGNRVPLPPPQVVSSTETGPGGSGQLVTAAINVTRAFSQFLGAAIQGAAHTFQNVVRAGQRVAGDYYSSGSG